MSETGLHRALQSGETHVWLTYEQRIDAPELLHRYRDILTDDERARCDRFVFADDRHRALVTRALVRTTLSRYVNQSPETWRFRFNRYGRPEIDSTTGPSSLRFNLSHTRGLVACIVSLEREIGVDVENRLRNGRLLGVAHRFFSPLEVEALDAIAPERRLARFFTYWTLKESYIKARGMGLAIPLDHFSFLLDQPELGIRIDFSPEIRDEPDRWDFTFQHLSPKHSLATAVERTTAGETPRVIVREVVPLSSAGWNWRKNL